jgi:uncharacterized membrane protein
MATHSTIWRTELWHPLLVHFPIVCLLLASVSGIFYGLYSDYARHPNPRRFPVWMLGLGVASAWISIWTGEYSFGKIMNADMFLLQEHQWWSYVSTVDYSAAFLLQLISGRLPGIFSALSHWMKFLLLLAGAAALMYSVYLGTIAVYDQGAGVVN